jgi:hypothetical protein
VSFLDVFIGQLAAGSDPLDWGGSWNSNIPTRESPFFPPSGAGRQFFEVVKKIEDGSFKGKQVDRCGWAAIVTKKQILQFIDETYRGDKTYSDTTYMPHLYEQMRELLLYVRALPDTEEFALIASET